MFRYKQGDFKSRNYLVLNSPPLQCCQRSTNVQNLYSFSHCDNLQDLLREIRKKKLSLIYSLSIKSVNKFL